jgi:hypothetical protein
MSWRCSTCKVTGETDEQYKAHQSVCPEHAMLRHQHMFPGCSSVVQWREKYHGQHAWIFGKGPSLDTFDQTLVDGPAFCVNESVLGVDAPDFFFALDGRPIDGVTKYGWPFACHAVLTENMVPHARNAGVPADRIIVGQRIDDYRRCVKSVRPPGCIHASDGTIATALDFAYWVGCPRATFVGCEGTGDYAKAAKAEYPANQPYLYAGFHEHLLKMAAEYGMEVEFHGAA